MDEIVLRLVSILISLDEIEKNCQYHENCIKKWQTNTESFKTDNILNI